MKPSLLQIKKRRARRTRVNLKRSGRILPRLSVFRSERYLSVQIIDDSKGATLASAHVKDIKGYDSMPRIEQAPPLGKLIAERAIKTGVSAVSFDRGAYAYHGLVKAIAEGAREGGLSL